MHRYASKCVKTHLNSSFFIIFFLQFSFLALTVVAIAALVIGQDLVELPADLTFSCDGRAYGKFL